MRVVATASSLYFFDPDALLPAGDEPLGGPVFRDADEWPGSRYQRDDPVLHIEFRKWADVLLVAPLDANTLAKFALGLSDNFLTCIFRAWDFERPVVLAPAMNTLMWQSPVTTASPAADPCRPRRSSWRSRGTSARQRRRGLRAPLPAHPLDPSPIETARVRRRRRRRDGGRRGDRGDRPSTEDDGGLIMFSLYTFGDSILDCGHYNRYRVTPGGLIVANDDALFPEFRGRNLSTRGPAP